jgi:uncharacterized protein YndB with AHSA1/START domain
MGAKSNATSDTAPRELVITRIFDAPRSLVFRAWTHPDHLKRWWGPHGFTVLACAMDFRVGGGWSLSMQSPAGVVDRQQGVFREIVEPERLVFTYAFEDEKGRRGHETIVTLSFADLGSKTELTLRQAVFESVAVRDDHVRGWGEALDHLAEYVTKV